MSEQNPREIAGQVLAQRARGEFVETLLEQAFARQPLSRADRHLCQELVYGVVRWLATLDWLISRKTQGRKQKPALQDCLRLGLYQLFWLERIPAHAAVHETVELAKQRGFGPQAGFVNALLRGYLREMEATRKLLAKLKLQQPHLGYSHPEWLVNRWQARYGTEATQRLLTWNNTPPKNFARVNALKAEPGALTAQWREEDVEYDLVRRDWLEETEVFELKAHPSLAQLPSFTQGRFYIQDPSTLLAVRQLAPEPGQDVLDFCAAPGGKLAFMAQLMGNQGRLLGLDTTPERIELVRENCTRLGVTAAQLRVTSSAPSPLLRPGSFDRILVDAPCSNTGVMRRRVELRWRIQPEELTRLTSIQLGLLRQAAPLLRSGGRLVYSTCSLEPEENQGVVETFLAEHRNFELRQERELRPFADNVDGAFVACLAYRQ